MLFRVFFSCLISRSIAACDSSAERMRRSLCITRASSVLSSSSSLRVPDGLTSTAGNTRRSEILRSSFSSALPVPLNSSKITVSPAEPVSTIAVAMMVRLPPSSMFRAAPKKRFGGYRALESTPPERIRPDAGEELLYARPRRVMESSSTTTSCPCSTRRFARSIANSATAV